MSQSQPGVLGDLPPCARFLTCKLRPGTDPRKALDALRERPADGSLVVGLGLSSVRALGTTVEGLREHPVLTGSGFAVPSTPAGLWCWLRGDDRGELVHATHGLRAMIGVAFDVEQVIDAFMHRDSRDLTGYEDGTENPKGDDAVAAAVVTGNGAGLDGSSFVAVQQWVHDFDRFQAMPQSDRDNVFGRRLSNNEEFEEAPPSAHVKRTAQEQFNPPAFILRRSMPWADAEREGLVFVAFGRSLDNFERLLRHMTGEDDGTTDALFRFTRPVTGAYFWCPPLVGGQLDLRAVGL